MGTFFNEFQNEKTAYKSTLNSIERRWILYGGNFFTVVLTVIHRRNAVIWIYFIAALLSKGVSGFFVTRYGMDGAAVLYLLTMGLAALLFSGCTVLIMKASVGGSDHPAKKFNT